MRLGAWVLFDGQLRSVIFNVVAWVDLTTMSWRAAMCRRIKIRMRDKPLDLLLLPIVELDCEARVQVCCNSTYMRDRVTLGRQVSEDNFQISTVVNLSATCINLSAGGGTPEPYHVSLTKRSHLTYLVAVMVFPNRFCCATTNIVVWKDNKIITISSVYYNHTFRE